MTNPDKFLQALTSNYKFGLAFGLYFGTLPTLSAVLAGLYLFLQVALRRAE